MTGVALIEHMTNNRKYEQNDPLFRLPIVRKKFILYLYTDAVITTVGDYTKQTEISMFYERYFIRILLLYHHYQKKIQYG